MPGGLLGFLVATFELVIVVWIFFIGMARVAADATLVLIARIAIGGMATVAFILACASVLGMGGGGRLVTYTPASVIELAVAVIVVIVAVFIINAVVDFLLGGAGASWFSAPPPAQPGQPVPAPSPVLPPGIAGGVKYVLQAVALIALLLAAGKALFGGGLGFVPHNFLT